MERTCHPEQVIQVAGNQPGADAGTHNGIESPRVCCRIEPPKVGLVNVSSARAELIAQEPEEPTARVACSGGIGHDFSRSQAGLVVKQAIRDAHRIAPGAWDDTGMETGALIRGKLGGCHAPITGESVAVRTGMEGANSVATVGTWASRCHSRMAARSRTRATRRSSTVTPEPPHGTSPEAWHGSAEVCHAMDYQLEYRIPRAYNGDSRTWVDCYPYAWERGMLMSQVPA
jgi:hypothetical protein